jgi:hypothetical protein
MRTIISSHVTPSFKIVSNTQEAINFAIVKIKERQQNFNMVGTIEKVPNRYIKDCYGFFVKEPDNKMYLQYYMILESSPFFNMMKNPGSPLYRLSFKHISAMPNQAEVIYKCTDIIYDMTRIPKAYNL